MRNTNKAYISYIDRSVVCIYPLLRSHVVERPCEEMKYLISTSGYLGLKEGMHRCTDTGDKYTGGPFWSSESCCLVSLGRDEAHGTQVLSRRGWLILPHMPLGVHAIHLAEKAPSRLFKKQRYLTRARTSSQELHVARVTPLLFLQSFRLFFHLQDPGLNGCQLLIVIFFKDKTDTNDQGWTLHHVKQQLHTSRLFQIS